MGPLKPPIPNPQPLFCGDAWKQFQKHIPTRWRLSGDIHSSSWWEVTNIIFNHGYSTNPSQRTPPPEIRV